VDAHQDVGHVLLVVRIESRPADRAPARLPLQQVDAMEVTGFTHQPPSAAILPIAAQVRVEEAGFAPDLHETRHPVSLWRGSRFRPSDKSQPRS
jgi:hypothetical protein